MTNRLIEAGKALGIEVLDHIIVGHGCRYSFQENGLISERETGECFAAEKDGAIALLYTFSYDSSLYRGKHTTP